MKDFSLGEDNNNKAAMEGYLAIVPGSRTRWM